MKTNGPLLLTIGFLLAPSLWGDTLKLKDGTTLEGTIIKDTPEEVVFSVEIRPGIREEKTFKGEEVAVVLPSTVDEKAFDIIKAYVPTPDRLTVTDYTKKVEKTKAFLNAFKKSKYRLDAAAILKTLQEEHALVQAGGMKLGEKWLTKEKIGSNAYEIDAQIIASDMMHFAANGPQISALRKFEELRTSYAGSSAFPLAVLAINDVLVSYQASVKSEIEQYEGRIKTREKEIATLNSSQRNATLEEIKRLSDNYGKRLAYEKKTKTKWLSLEPYHLQPMKDTLRIIDRELQALENFDATKLKPVSEIYRNAWAAATDRNRAKVETLAKELTAARVQKEYLKLIETHLLTREGEAKAAGEGDYVEPEEPEDAPAPAPEEPVVEEAPKADISTRSSERNTDPSSSSESESAADEEEPSSMLRSVLFSIIGIVIVVALVVAFTGKKKEDDA